MTYIDDAIRTENQDYAGMAKRFTDETVIRLDHAAKGFCTEAGEFQDVLKKYIIYGKDIDRVNLIEELGDFFWYLAIAAHALGVTFEEIQDTNIAKLRARYPQKFTEEAAITRDLEAERALLEFKTAEDATATLIRSYLNDGVRDE